MADNQTEITSFVDQIVEKTFDALAVRADFDEATLARFRELGDAKGLSNPELVIIALVGDEGA